jgi:hypothetical protein
VFYRHSHSDRRVPLLVMGSHFTENRKTRHKNPVMQGWQQLLINYPHDRQDIYLYLSSPSKHNPYSVRVIQNIPE